MGDSDMSTRYGHIWTKLGDLGGQLFHLFRCGEERNSGRRAEIERDRKGPKGSALAMAFGLEIGHHSEGNEQDCRAGLYILVAIVSVKWNGPAKWVSTMKLYRSRAQCGAPLQRVSEVSTCFNCAGRKRSMQNCRGIFQVLERFQSGCSKFMTYFAIFCNWSFHILKMILYCIYIYIDIVIYI